MDLRELGQQGDVRHPWEQARARLVQKLVGLTSMSDGPIERVLDVGAGDGWLAWQLAEALGTGIDIVCYDRFYDDAVLDQLNGAGPANVHHSRHVDGAPADLVLALDVVEHVENDQDFVRELVDHLRPGGRILVTVPGHMSLYGAHDVALGHYRRYGRRELVQLLETGGLSVDASGELFNAILGVRAAQVRLQRRRPEHEVDEVSEYLHWTGPDWLAKGIAQGLVAEGLLSIALSQRGVRVPGLSCWASAHRPAA